LTLTPPVADSWILLSFTDFSIGNDLVINGTANGIDSGLLPDSTFVTGTARVSNPEPSSFALTGLGVIGLGLVHRFRRRRAAKQVVSV
jgi:hypothetical protein